MGDTEGGLLRRQVKSRCICQYDFIVGDGCWGPDSSPRQLTGAESPSLVGTVEDIVTQPGGVVNNTLWQEILIFFF